jgi:hypothetical protein
VVEAAKADSRVAGAKVEVDSSTGMMDSSLAVTEEVVELRTDVGAEDRAAPLSDLVIRLRCGDMDVEGQEAIILSTTGESAF